MKKKDYRNELKSMTEAELNERAATLSQELMKLRFRKKTGQLEQSHRTGEITRNIARVLTALNEKRTTKDKSAAVSVK